MYQMPYTQYPFPIYGTAPPQMKLDTHGSPSPVETNQGVFNHGQLIPAGCHGCCNYGYIPAYFSQPYFHPPQPQPFYYPSFSPMCHPVHYSPPPPYYPVDQPRYEFDKNNHLTDHHCCGCPNSHCNTKQDPHVTTQQTKPNIEDLHSSSLVPIEPISHPYSNELQLKKSDQNPYGSRVEDKVKTTGKSNKDEIEGERNQFPFPIFWLPCKNDSENQKEYDKGSSSTKGENRMMIENVKENEGIESGMKETRMKNSNPKLIPVKHVVENREERDKLIVKEKGNKEIKPQENVAKKKLPPVCLRVEPLTKKKSGCNGKSNESKPSSSTQNDKNKVESAEKVGKTLELVDGKTGVEVEKVECLKDTIKEKEEKIPGAKPEVANVSEKTVKKLSEDDAAVVIQSAYRGLEVRRWDPIKKLKQINEIRVKVDEVRGRIEALKASSDSSSSLDKQRLVIGETIMSLLLKLDTVQGLHPTVRERRKSVAKELMSLTEQLDSLGIIKSSESRTLELKGDPMEGHAKAEESHENKVSEESKDGSVAVCELNDGENLSSVELVSDHQEDLHNHETVIDECSFSERKVPSPAAGEALTDLPSVSDGESSLQEDMKDGQISMEICKEPHDGDMKPADVANENATTIAATDIESNDSLKDETRREMATTEKDSVKGNDDQESKEYSLPEDLKDEIRREMGTGSGESNCLDAFKEKSCIEDECAGKQELYNMMQLQGDQQAENTDSVFATKPDEPEGPKPGEFHGEEEEEEEALKPEDMKRCETETEPEMEPQSKYVLESADPEDDKNVEHPEDAKLNQEKQDESEREPKESQESENKYVHEVSQVGNDKNMNINQEKQDEIGGDKKLEEENAKLREMVAKLVESGKEQLSVISSLSGRVKDLEMKLGKKKKPKTGRVRVRSSRVKASDHNTVNGVAAANGNR